MPKCDFFLKKRTKEKKIAYVLEFMLVDCNHHAMTVLFDYSGSLACSCTVDVREKVPSFQKATPFLRYKIFNRYAINLGFCLFEDVTDHHD